MPTRAKGPAASKPFFFRFLPSARESHLLPKRAGNCLILKQKGTVNDASNSAGKCAGGEHGRAQRWKPSVSRKKRFLQPTLSLVTISCQTNPLKSFFSKSRGSQWRSNFCDGQVTPIAPHGSWLAESGSRYQVSKRRAKPEAIPCLTPQKSAVPTHPAFYF